MVVLNKFQLQLNSKKGYITETISSVWLIIWKAKLKKEQSISTTLITLKLFFILIEVCFYFGIHELFLNYIRIKYFILENLRNSEHFQSVN